MHILTALVNLVENTQERCRRIGKRFHLNPRRNSRTFHKGNAAFLERIDKGSPKIRDWISHREHQLTRIDSDANRSPNRNLGFFRIKRPGPLSFFPSNRHHFVFQDNITYIRQDFCASGIANLFAGLKSNHRAVVIKAERCNFCTIPRIIEILAPVFRFPGALVIRGVQKDCTRNRIDSQSANGIRHSIQHIERICIIASRKIRVTFTANLDRSKKIPFTETSIQGDFRFRGIVERQVMDSRRCRQSFQRTCRRKLFRTADIPDFISCLYRTNRKSVT